MSLTLLGCGGPTGSSAPSYGVPHVIASSLNTSGTSASFNSTVDAPSGVLLALISYDTSTTPTISDSVGGTWTARAFNTSGFADNKGFSWFSKPVSADHPIGTTFNITAGTSAFLTAIVVHMPGTTVFDTNINASAGAPSGSPNPLVVSASPSVATEYALANVMGQNGYSAAVDDATWTLLIDDGFRNHILYKQAAGTGGYSYSEVVNTSNWGAGIVGAK